MDISSLTLTSYIFAGLAALGAGFVNALAGGGTLISFPVLNGIFAAMPEAAKLANATNTVALVPGYLGATFAQIKDLQAQKRRVWLYLPGGMVGGIVGALLLLNTGEKQFQELIPFLILLASVLLALSDTLRAWVLRRAGQGASTAATVAAWGVLPVAIAAIYGGYFGAGLSVIVLAMLGLFINDSLTRLNALKQVIAFGVNIAAALVFVFSGKVVVWPVALVMMVFALLGGNLGGRVAGRIKPATLRWVVVVIGFGMAIYYFLK